MAGIDMKNIKGVFWLFNTSFLHCVCLRYWHTNTLTHCSRVTALKEMSHLDFSPLPVSEVELIIVVTPLQALFLNVGEGSPHDSQ